MKKSTWVFIAFLAGIIGGGLLYRHVAQERDARGATRLMRALEENDTEKMEQFLTVEEVNTRDKSGQTPLFYAARNASQPQVIHKLLLLGADAFAKDKQGHTPLMAAAQYNNSPLITLVLARQGGFSQEQIENKNEALFLAARYNVAPVIKTLLIAHASPGTTDTNHKQAADYLDENEQLSEREKTDLRQVMLLLEILEQRKQFEAAAVTRTPEVKQMAADSAKPEKPTPTPPAPTEKKLANQ